MHHCTGRFHIAHGEPMRASRILVLFLAAGGVFPAHEVIAAEGGEAKMGRWKGQQLYVIRIIEAKDKKERRAFEGLLTGKELCQLGKERCRGVGELLREAKKACVEGIGLRLKSWAKFFKRDEAKELGEQATQKKKEARELFRTGISDMFGGPLNRIRGWFRQRKESLWSRKKPSTRERLTTLLCAEDPSSVKTKPGEMQLLLTRFLGDDANNKLALSGPAGKSLSLNVQAALKEKLGVDMQPNAVEWGEKKLPVGTRVHFAMETKEGSPFNSQGIVVGTTEQTIEPNEPDAAAKKVTLPVLFAKTPHGIDAVIPPPDVFTNAFPFETEAAAPK